MKVPSKVKKAERAEMAAMKGGKSHAQAEKVEQRVLKQYKGPKKKR
jgi:hypothetical protein